MKKLILILTLIFALALCFVACDVESNEGGLAETPTTEAPTTEASTVEEPTTKEADAPIDYTEEGDTPYVNIPYEMSLIADLYFALGESGEVDSIYLDVTDGKLTIGDVWFDEISYGENVEVKYDDFYDYYYPEIGDEEKDKTPDPEREREIAIVLNRIAQQKNCYLLKSSTDNGMAEFITAYYFNGTCYLALFNDGIVSKIYSMEVEYAEPVLVDGMNIVGRDIGSYAGVVNSGIQINVYDGQLYNFGHLREIKYYNKVKINIEWCDEHVHFRSTPETGPINGTNPSSEEVHYVGMKLLEKINREKGCFVIYSAETEAYYEELAIFVFDGVYYFIDITKTNRSNACIYLIMAAELVE